MDQGEKGEARGSEGDVKGEGRDEGATYRRERKGDGERMQRVKG